MAPRQRHQQPARQHRQRRAGPAGRQHRLSPRSRSWSIPRSRSPTRCCSSPSVIPPRPNVDVHRRRRRKPAPSSQPRTSQRRQNWPLRSSPSKTSTSTLAVTFGATFCDGFRHPRRSVRLDQLNRRPGPSNNITATASVSTTADTLTFHLGQRRPRARRSPQPATAPTGAGVDIKGHKRLRPLALSMRLSPMWCRRRPARIWSPQYKPDHHARSPPPAQDASFNGQSTC